ncbi:hypothetical protein DUNSADRAFT_11503 [Dunaliella salina]|uniref:Encoded protein n=1 Tax=Dunaliella salina TaxID=3046 RepID=A0ABQ7GDG1_DUNSA|nr:hypothetical protein DUNSADRAFT_11503 [Dunaliella salina]|eukprot:KAF5832573.1 hypothetical protein DUNSADRAFT_11503 [Dunaliella salina]
MDHCNCHKLSLILALNCSIVTARSPSNDRHGSVKTRQGRTSPIIDHCNCHKESIVTDMVRLKHGKDAIVSNKLVKEANISLSAWMASSKERTHNKSAAKKGGGVAGAPNTGSIASFAASYLGDNKSPRLEAASDGAPTANDEKGATFVANQKKANAPKGPFIGMSHDQVARTLGTAAQAALQAHKAQERVKRGSEDSCSSEGVSDSEGKPSNGRVSPLKMAQRLSKSSEHQAVGSQSLKRQNTTSLSGRPQTSGSGTPATTTDRRLQKSFTLANEGSSYTDKKQAAGVVEPSRMLPSRHGSFLNKSPRPATSGSGSSTQRRATSSQGLSGRLEVPHLRQMPISGELPTTTSAADRDSAKSSRSRQGSAGRSQIRIQEQDAGSSQRQRTHTPSHPPLSQPSVFQPQPPSQLNLPNLGHSNHSSRGTRPPLAPPPHPIPHPQGQPVINSQVRV